MQRLADKLILFFLCFLPLLWRGEKAEIPVVAAFLTAVVVSSLGNVMEAGQWKWIAVCYCLLGFWKREFCLFLALVAYDCFTGQKKWRFRLFWTLSLFAFAGGKDLRGFITTAFFCTAACFLSVRTRAYINAMGAYFRMQDSTREQALYLEKKNQELMEKQDYEVRLATLNERNRIAREIHDNVGHLLTRSLLQVSAMMVVHKQAEEVSGQLDQVKETLSEAMDSVRESVHNLHDEAVDLELQLKKLTEEFRFCPVELRYKAGKLPAQISYCMIAIAKEGLSNIARHSNASRAEISVVEHPAICQLVIQDNGTGAEGMGSGIGLQNIRERAEALGGNFRADRENGFRLFVSLPLSANNLEKRRKT
ncbi:MAG: sensor histidine kinase [Lachnospiraceae bacterium]|nr:sensor histidine kinase [Lachnospiraceae bacterium]